MTTTRSTLTLTPGSSPMRRPIRANGRAPAERVGDLVDHEVTRLFERLKAGEEGVRNDLLLIIYSELKAIAARKLKRQAPGYSLQTTDLAHEAFAKLFANGSPDVNDRKHFYCIAATAMTQIILDHAKRKNSEKRTPPGEQQPLLDDLVDAYQRSLHDIVAWKEALESLRADDPQMAQAIELKVILQLPDEEIAKIVDLPLRTLQRYWEPTRKRLWRDLQ